MEKVVCNSCKKSIANDSGTVHFKCPKCGKSDIIRCSYCRKIVAKYKCHECNFEGPN
ncbi:MAG: RNA-binding protein [Nanoarchaeota archaeon]|nr:RNA-binding protein [Nanoarchaeota archaeon]